MGGGESLEGISLVFRLRMLQARFDESFIRLNLNVIFFSIMFQRMLNLLLWGEATQNVHLERDINLAVQKMKKTLRETNESYLVFSKILNTRRQKSKLSAVL